MADIRDFILEEVKQETEETADTKTKKQTKKKTDVVYELVVEDPIDVIIRRKTAKTSKILALMPSVRQYYIKNEKNAEITRLQKDEVSAKAIAAFMKEYGSSDIGFDASWVKLAVLCKPTVAQGLLSLLNITKMEQLIKRGYICFEEDDMLWAYKSAFYSDYVGRVALLATPHCAELFNFAPNKQEAKRIFTSFVVGRSHYYGRRNGGFELSSILTSLDHDNQSGSLPDINFFRSLYAEYRKRPYHNFFVTDFAKIGEIVGKAKTTTLIEYLVYETMRMGYTSQYEFMSEWRDTLRMQKLLRGKVYDKYPKDLPLMHNKLAFQCSLRRAEINEAGFKEHRAESKKHEFSYGALSIRCPFSPDDMIEAATSLSNCLAGYVDRYAEYKSDIYFIVDKEDEHKYYGAIEVIDGRINQAYGPYNHRLSGKELALVLKWAKQFGFSTDCRCLAA